VRGERQRPRCFIFFRFVQHLKKVNDYRSVRFMHPVLLHWMAARAVMRFGRVDIAHLTIARGAAAAAERD
jgi:hypothetical protein